MSVSQRQLWQLRKETGGQAHEQRLLPLLRTNLQKRMTPEHRQLAEALGVTNENTDVPLRMGEKTIFVDILLPDLKLVVEVDGSTHAQKRQRQEDKARDCALESLGYSVLRFWNWDIEERLETVLSQIRSFTTSK